MTQSLELLTRTVLTNNYIPHVPTAKQAVFLSLPTREAMYGGAAGGGKLLYNYTMIPTPYGFRKLNDLVPGDYVFGLDGKVHTILAESEIVHAPAYRLTFDDGSELIAHDDHRWLTYDATELAALTRRDPEFRARRRAARPSRASGNRSERFTTAIIERNRLNPPATKDAPTGTVRTTDQIVSTLRTPAGRSNHAIPVTAPLDLPERELPLDPYLLGLWLGDGTARNGSITTMDPEFVLAFDAVGFPVMNTQRKPQNRAATYRFGGLLPVLKALGVLGNKHIPDAYLWASESQRAALLAGLLDTDGNVNGASIEFVNTNRALTEGVAQLARSLGHKVRLRESRARINGRDVGPKWSVKFAANRILFRLARKAEQQQISTRRTTKFRYIVAAERVDPVDLKCIRVSAPDGLFLAGEHFIATHNSDALLMAALQYVHVPGYSALLLRRTYADLALPGALMDRATEWLAGTDARWNENTKTWTFPSGATLTFGYLEIEKHKYRYQGSEFQFIAFDELTQFTQPMYAYMFSRLRRLEGSDVPLRMRAASNPGGEGHEWVYERFVALRSAERQFIPANLNDNPYLDHDEYVLSLSELDPITRDQLLKGLWVIDPTTRAYQRDWWRQQNRFDSDDDPLRRQVIARYISWDTALKDKESSAYSAYTVGELLPNYQLLIREVWRDKLIFPDLVSTMRDVARRYNHDDKLRGFIVEDKASGTSAIQTISNADDWLAQLLIPFMPSGDKPYRYQQSAVWCKLGMVWLPQPSGSTPWLHDFERELFGLPDSEFKDMGDSFAQLIIYLEHYLSAGWHARGITDDAA